MDAIQSDGFHTTPSDSPRSANAPAPSTLEGPNSRNKLANCACNPYAELSHHIRERPQCIVDRYMDGKIQIDPMITHKLPLERINEAFDLMHQGKSIRSVVVF